MAVKSIYWPEPDLSDPLVTVSGEENRHLQVSRTNPGEAVELFDGTGRVWSGEVVEVDRRWTRVRIGADRRVPPPEAEIVLGQALIRNAAFELALEKVVELGVTRVIPFQAARSNADSQGRERRWRKIIVEAAKQSKRYHLPRLDPVTAFRDLIALDVASKLMFAERREGRLGAALAGSPVLYLIGPEGGWTPPELESAADAGFRMVGLGAHILRSETAAVVGGALIAHHLGVL